MNTESHEGVSKKAGMPILRAAFGDLNSLEAVLLGNWLTDVSQAVDPTSFEAANDRSRSLLADFSEWLKDLIRRVVPEVVGTIWEDVPGLRAVRNALEEALKENVERAVKQLTDTVDALFAMRTDDARSACLAEWFRNLFFVVGYFKFVHPDSAAKGPRLEFDGYSAVFGQTGSQRADLTRFVDRPGGFSQYYPHEHLDRPELRDQPSDPPIYAPGRRTLRSHHPLPPPIAGGTRAKGRRVDLDPDLYSYLRDDMEITAGLLTEIDLEFRDLMIGGKKIREDDNWHQTLAKLGHALHQVEDFFAHSNWIELVGRQMGEGFFEKALPMDTPFEIVNRVRTTYAKRLKRHLTEPLPDWRDHPDEDWVVTGFVDEKDGLISLAHLTEELWGGDVPDPWARGNSLAEDLRKKATRPDLALDKFRIQLRQALDFLSDPERESKNPENWAATWYNKKYGKSVGRLRRPGVREEVAGQLAQHLSILNRVPASSSKKVVKALLDIFVEGTRAYEVGGATFSIYVVIREVSEFVRNPIAWLADLLPEWLYDRVKGALIFYAKERFYDALGGGRIGCHSLIAKDYRNEPLFRFSTECAAAVHWYIVKTLVRWGSDTPKQPIDWLELLEFFLRNPLRPTHAVEYKVPPGGVTIQHITKAGDQLGGEGAKRSLEKVYRPTAVKGQEFSWRTIADANFDTSRLSEEEAKVVINAALRSRAIGIPVTPPNWAFKAGVTVRIPNQVTRIPVGKRVEGSVPSWYRTVIDQDWREFRRLYETATGEDRPSWLHQTCPLSDTDAKAVIQRGYLMRAKKRQDYLPRGGPR